MPGGRHGTRSLIRKGDDLEKAAPLRMTRDDPIRRTDEAGQGSGIGKGRHVREVIGAMAMNAIRLKHRTHAGKGTRYRMRIGSGASAGENDGQHARDHDDAEGE